MPEVGAAQHRREAAARAGKAQSRVVSLEAEQRDVHDGDQHADDRAAEDLDVGALALTLLDALLELGLPGVANFGQLGAGVVAVANNLSEKPHESQAGGGLRGYSQQQQRRAEAVGRPHCDTGPAAVGVSGGGSVAGRCAAPQVCKKKSVLGAAAKRSCKSQGPAWEQRRWWRAYWK